MHEYTVELRVHSPHLNPDYVTDILGLEPNMVIQAGDARGQGGVWEESIWAFNGVSMSTEPKIWYSMDEGLGYILSKLMPIREEIQKLNSKHRVTLWCGHFQASFDGGPTLSPATLRMLGDLGVELFIDNYFTQDDAGTKISTQGL